MAKETTSPTPADLEQGASSVANAAARAQVIQDGFAKRYAEEQAIDEAHEKHIAPLKKSLAKIKKDMKNDADMTAKDLNLGYALYKRGRIAEDFMDEEEGGNVHDNLKFIFKSLEEGGQVNFLDLPDIVAATVH